MHTGQAHDRAPAKGILDELGGWTLKAFHWFSGFGNAHCGHLPRSAVDLEGGFIDFPRPKTGIPRRCPLWPETVDAIRESLDVRPSPRDPADADLVFVTKYGGSWAKDDDPAAITKEMRKLLNSLGIKGRRNFYTLRHTFRTVADEARDQPAADYIMGHEVPHMSSVYRERISDDRLRAVVDQVRRWLFNGPETTPSATGPHGRQDGSGPRRYLRG